MVPQLKDRMYAFIAVSQLQSGRPEVDSEAVPPQAFSRIALNCAKILTSSSEIEVEDVEEDELRR